MAVRGRLARQTVRGPRHRLQPLRSNLTLAPETRTVRAIRDPLERSSHALQSAEIRFDPADRQFTIRGPLNAIQRVWSVLDGDFITPPKHVFGAVQDPMEDLFEVSKFSGLH